MIARQHQSLKWAKALDFSVRFRTAATFGPESIKLNPGLPPERPSKWEWCSPQKFSRKGDNDVNGVRNQDGAMIEMKG